MNKKHQNLLMGLLALVIVAGVTFLVSSSSDLQGRFQAWEDYRLYGIDCREEIAPSSVMVTQIPTDIITRILTDVPTSILTGGTTGSTTGGTTGSTTGGTTGSSTNYPTISITRVPTEILTRILTHVPHCVPTGEEEKPRFNFGGRR